MSLTTKFYSIWVSRQQTLTPFWCPRQPNFTPFGFPWQLLWTPLWGWGKAGAWQKVSLLKLRNTWAPFTKWGALLYCTLYSLYSILSTVHCTLYTVHLHYTLYTVHCTPYFTLYTVHCTLYTVHCTELQCSSIWGVKPFARLLLCLTTPEESRAVVRDNQME